METHTLSSGGIVKDEHYDQRVAEKLAFYTNNNIKLISVYPSDLTRLDEILAPLLPRQSPP